MPLAVGSGYPTLSARCDAPVNRAGSPKIPMARKKLAGAREVSGVDYLREQTLERMPMVICALEVGSSRSLPCWRIIGQYWEARSRPVAGHMAARQLGWPRDKSSVDGAPTRCAGGSVVGVAGHYYPAGTRPRATHMADRPQEMMLWSSRTPGSLDLLLSRFPGARVTPFQRPSAGSLALLLHPRGITGRDGFHLNA